MEWLLEGRGQLYLIWGHGFPLGQVREVKIGMKGGIVGLNIGKKLFVVVDTGNRPEETVDFRMF